MPPPVSRASTWGITRDEPLILEPPDYRDEFNVDHIKSSPWARKIILCLDGGGVRGYASLLILEKLMDKIESKEKNLVGSRSDSSAAYPWRRIVPDSPPWKNDFRVHHYFDYIFGTSTGGLSALMLGRLRSTVAQTREQYDAVGREVFSKKQHVTGNGYIRRLYSTTDLEQTLANAVCQRVSGVVPKEPVPSNSTHLVSLADVPGKLRTAVMAFQVKTTTDETGGNPLMYRSYTHPRIPRSGKQPIQPFEASNVPVHRIGLGTSAAPRYFSSVEIDGTTVRDGALAGANNPVRVAWEEVRFLHPDNYPLLILSIGTGKKLKKPLSKRQRIIQKDDTGRLVIQAWQRYKQEIISSEAQHVDFEQKIAGKNNGMESADSRIIYYRLNVEEGLDKVKLADWRGELGAETKQTIREAVEIYVAQDDVAKKLEDCAAKLVEVRRKRHTTVRWEEFAMDVVYDCPSETGRRGGGCNVRRNRDELRKHLEDVHGIMAVAPRTQCDRYIVCQRGGHKALLLDSDDDYLKHLEDDHGMYAPEVVGGPGLENLLDKARQAIPNPLGRSNPFLPR